MTAPVQQAIGTSIDPATQVGLLSLTVADLERSLAYYTQAIGLALLERDGPRATLGVAGKPILLLEEQPGTNPWPRGGRSYTGLYHFAILLPSHADLGRWIRNWFELQMPFPGQGDHAVSQALYLEDPDGHGIEMYRDRPRDEWLWQDGQVQMTTGPVDIQGLLEAAEREGKSWTGLPEGTHLGHMHLQVGDIPQAAAFYHDVLGFDIVAQMPSALFISAGGYHHHIGMNTWHNRGAEPAPAASVRLRFFTVDLPNAEALESVVDRIKVAGISFSRSGDVVTVQDPWQNTVLLQAGTAESVQEAAELARLATN